MQPTVCTVHASMFTFTWHTWHKNTVYITTEILQHAWLSWAAFSLVCCMTPLAYIGLNGMVAPLLLPSAHSTEYTCTVAVHQDTLGSSRGGPPADFAKQASCSHWDRLAEQLSASSFRPSLKLRGVSKKRSNWSFLHPGGHQVQLCPSSVSAAIFLSTER